MNKTTSDKVSLFEKVGYSLGDCSANFVFQMIMVYQAKFYTDVFGLEGAVAGAVMLIARIIDAFADPAVGVLSDRTQTRWGKYRPWILWTALPFMVFYVLAFYNPGIENKVLLSVYATISYTLLMALYSFNNTPYASLGGVMTGDSKARISINSVRFVVVTTAQFVVQGLALPLVNKFSNGGEDMQRGWLYMVSIFAIIVTIFLIITFLTTRERITPPANQSQNTKQDLKDIFGSVSWRSMFLLTLFIFTTLALWGSSMNYYFENYVDSQALYQFLKDIGLTSSQIGDGIFGRLLNSFGLVIESPAQAYAVGFGLFNMVGALVQFVGVIFLAGYLANNFCKRMVFIICLFLTSLFTAMFFLPEPSDIRLMFTLNILKSLAYAPTVPLLWTMMADVADHSEYVNHRRATGVVFAGVVFGLKAGVGIGGAILGFILSAFGYVSEAGFNQSSSAVTGIVISSSLVPAFIFMLGVVALFFYPITKNIQIKIQEELELRRNQ